MPAKKLQEISHIDWNAKARRIYILQENSPLLSSYKGLSLKWDGKYFEGQPDEKELEIFVDKHSSKLNHGDLLSVPNEYRGSCTNIVLYDGKDKKMKAMKNPDDLAAGYLTIPKLVLQNVTNAMEKYKTIFANDEYQIVNMHLSPRDAFIQKKLGIKVIHIYILY